VKVDRWSRAIYDRIPEPPPKGPKGADRITICADTDGDGRADGFKGLITGLNLCTGVEFGHGGVYDFLAHPSCLVVEDPTFETVKLITSLVKDAGDKATITGLDAFAKRVTPPR
jgi:hypothetical protein